MMSGRTKLKGWINSLVSTQGLEVAESCPLGWLNFSFSLNCSCFGGLAELFQVQENAPLYTNFVEGNGGTPQKGETLSHADVLRLEAWPTVAAILDKKYVEV